MKYSCLFTICLLLASCASLPLTDPGLQAQNQPIRTLNVLVIYDPWYGKVDLADALGMASDSLKQQVGIKIKPAFIQCDLPNSLGAAMNYLRIHYQDSDYDNVIGFIYKKDIARTSNSFNGVRVALTENAYRRFTVMTIASSHVLIHEIGHYFLFSHLHSSSGVMAAEGLATSNLFSPADRAEILTNKWRDFKVKPLPKM
jgi:predicted Zn-dependent protease with MMP-like domain